MADYNPELCKTLRENFQEENILRPLRRKRYDDGEIVSYYITSVESGENILINLRIEKFVGGGFAGQVYKVLVLDFESGEEEFSGLKKGSIYAMKILIPPSGFSLFFRNLVYFIGFQGPFQLQVNPFASRAGAIWQKFLRRAAEIKFGSEKTVVDIYATFIDEQLGSCGELSEWIEGRTWKLEVDDRLDSLKKWRRGKIVNDYSGSSEYRGKKEFMREFVDLTHRVGCYEFARQYEWSTCKSQPNCLKRLDNDEQNLVAVDFRAGLALLPFLPMSPGDIKLIFKGILRGSLVQFDRGDLSKLEKFVTENEAEFSDMKPMLTELKEAEAVYRDSVPDISHNHFRLLFSGKLWKQMLESAVTGWKIRKMIDDRSAERFGRNRFLTFLIFILNLIPFLGRILTKFLANANFRKHYGKMLISPKYFAGTIRATMYEKLIGWYRNGRIDEQKTARVSSSFPLFLVHLVLSILPAGMHKFFSDWSYFKERFHFIFIRPIKLYFDANLREEWLLDMVEEGKKKNMVSDADVEIIHSQLKEPYIQKYLKSLAVHVCTLPVTQVVSVLIAIIYVLTHPEMPRAQAWGIGVGIIALFQVIPISPGSLVRGLYVLYLVIKDRDFKNYNIAVFLAFFKYIGYLAFPIQMTYHYPALARFMAGHWATEAVHVVPVFGESGALLEHWVFGLFYNWPLTIRRNMKLKAEKRRNIKNRYWHIIFTILFTNVIIASAEAFYYMKTGDIPTLQNIWWAFLAGSLVNGVAVHFGGGGTQFGKRIISSVISGILIGITSTVATYYLALYLQVEVDGVFAIAVWRMFVVGVFSGVGTILTELRSNI